MRFLVDRCAGRRIATRLAALGHDVVDAGTFRTDPGDEALLRLAAVEGRIVVTIDTDFGHLLFARGLTHAGLIRLPDVRIEERIGLLETILDRHADALRSSAVVTVKSGRIRVSSGSR